MKFSQRVLSLFLTAALLLTCLPVTAFADSNKVTGIGFITLDGQRLYKTAASSSEVLAVTHEGECVLVLSKKNAMWYNVIYNGMTGFLYAGCLDLHTDLYVELGYGAISSSKGKILTGPGDKYTEKDDIRSKKEYYIVGFKDNWYKIMVTDKQTGEAVSGYVDSRYMELTDIPCQNEGSLYDPLFSFCGETFAELPFVETTPVLRPEYADSLVFVNYAETYNKKSLVANAKQFVDVVPYKSGGADLNGFDCSGLVYFCYGLMNIKVPHSAQGLYSCGKSVSRSKLQSGDLVFFGEDSENISHVAIYAGDGRVIHAPDKGRMVSYASLSTFDNYVGARRLG